MAHGTNDNSPRVVSVMACKRLSPFEPRDVNLRFNAQERRLFPRRSPLSLPAAHARQCIHAASPLFEGFPDKHLPCRNVTGMGCDAFYDCPSWVGFGKKSRATRPPPCCGIPYSSIGSLNLSRLQCYSYATVYNRAPIKVANPYTSIAPAFLCCRRASLVGCGFESGINWLAVQKSRGMRGNQIFRSTDAAVPAKLSCA